MTALCKFSGFHCVATTGLGMYELAAVFSQMDLFIAFRGPSQFLPKCDLCKEVSGSLCTGC